jgi:hypothetical protein
VVSARELGVADRAADTEPEPVLEDEDCELAPGTGVTAVPAVADAAPVVGVALPAVVVDVAAM